MLYPQIAKRILMFLQVRVSNRNDPRSIGKALKGLRVGNLGKLCWLLPPYQQHLGQYFAHLVVKIGNRREVYR